MREDVAANAAILRRLAEINKTLLVHDVTLSLVAFSPLFSISAFSA
jgi:hypothetical protein